MKKILEELGTIVANYKTSFMGLGSVVCVGLYWGNIINQEQFITGTALLTAMGLLKSKDS